LVEDEEREADRGARRDAQRDPARYAGRVNRPRGYAHTMRYVAAADPAGPTTPLATRRGAIGARDGEGSGLEVIRTTAAA